ncbi:MAG: caspase family protein [Candidatus Azobacteroides sp.]|nr:caspase family protein [Candidatus Azobacteroides sp.]
MKKTVLFIILSFFMSLSFAQQTRNLKLVKAPTGSSGGQKRKAVVIGMSNYGGNKSLNNTLNDADDMADVFTRLGFQVTLLKNNDLRSLRTNLTDWYNTIERNDMAVFYFAGHGVEVNGINYLIPVDAELNSEADIRYEALSVNQVLDNMDLKQVHFKLLILDACRDNPWTRGWSRSSSEKGLAQMSAPKGTLIAFAAAPGATAQDGGVYNLRNGVFTHFLKEEILREGASIDNILNRVAGNVSNLTNDRQLPYKTGILTEDFYFIPPGNDSPGPFPFPSPAVDVAGVLKISSVPEQEAVVIIDGIGQPEKTPASFQLSEGSHRVVVSKEFYLEAHREVKITKGQTTEIKLSLTPNYANINIRSDDDGEIWIDGELKATGNWQGKLEAGLHALAVEKESHRPYKNSIDVKPGNDRKLKIPALKPVYGKLNIASTGNIKTTVYVDGVKRSKGIPCVLKDVLTGERQIRLVSGKSDYQAYETVVDISEGKITDLNVVLAKADEEKPLDAGITIGKELNFVVKGAEKKKKSSVKLYLDNQWIGETDSGKRFPLKYTDPRPGTHELRVVWAKYEWKGKINTAIQTNFKVDLNNGKITDLDAVSAEADEKKTFDASITTGRELNFVFKGIEEYPNSSVKLYLDNQWIGETDSDKGFQLKYSDLKPGKRGWRVVWANHEWKGKINTAEKKDFKFEYKKKKTGFGYEEFRFELVK